MSLEIRIANGEGDLKKCFHVRYQVFIKELKFGSPKDFPDECESDEYDPLKTTIHFLAVHDDKGVATARLIGPNKEYAKNGKIFGLPMEDLYDLSKFKEQRIKPYEISRSSVVKDERSSIVILDTWKILINYCTKYKIKTLVSCAGTETDSYEDVMCINKIAKLKKLFHTKLKTKSFIETEKKDSPKYFLYDNKLKKQFLKDESIDTDKLKEYEEKGMKLPATLDYFVRLGISLTGPPILFPKFKMYTFPMIINLSKLNEPFKTFFDRKSDHIKI